MSSGSTDTLPRSRYADTYRAWHGTAGQIRAEGAIGSLPQGIEVEIHGVSTRIIVWPGNGFQTESVHVLTLEAGQEMEMHTYGMAEAAMPCLSGGGGRTSGASGSRSNPETSRSSRQGWPMPCGLAPGPRASW